ncbi:MAG: cysteine desulfurase NifS [Chloroflexi bacterium]|nr:cysteine desulfurase NifS [Chloroflexota bacterium]|tara:strand:- start:129 stop:1301 length:1173 start_codon:yes stop_codon:yes gene_type:complete
MNINDYIYLDNAATTKIKKKVLDSMIPHLESNFGNPSSLYSFGQESRNSIEESREKISTILHSKPSEIIFTSGGTEANNLAILGSSYAMKDFGNHIITSSIEHHAVLHPCEELEKEGFEVDYLPVDKFGLVSPKDLKNAIKPNTILVSIMMANNEIGTIQDMNNLIKVVREKQDSNNLILFHSDAVQSLGKMEINLKNMDVDLLSVSGHKINGPKGIGALFVRRGTPLRPIIFGGGQEKQLRSGTENVAAIVGFAEALFLAESERENFNEKCTNLRDKLSNRILELIPQSFLNGHPTERLSNIVNISFDGVEGEPILVGLDLAGIYASSGSACSSGSLDPSHVLISTGLNPKLALGSIRFSLSPSNSEEEIFYVVKELSKIIKTLREMAS